MVDTVLLMGGDSPEREVSLMSGDMVLAALKRAAIDTIVVDPLKESLTTLSTMSVRRVFNILHGGAGENGEICGALKMMNIPVTGSGVLGSALAMDKHRAKLLWTAQGIPTPPWRLVEEMTGVDEVARQLGLPLFVKPAAGGSSTHACRVTKAAALAAAVEMAMQEDGAAMVEQWIEGREYTMGVLDDAPLPLIHIQAAGEFYDYHAKYIAENTQFICPCGLSEKDETVLQAQALKAFVALGCRHWGRVDFIMSDDGPMFLEVNTVPGMTSHSLVPIAARACGISYDELVCKILEGAA